MTTKDTAEQRELKSLRDQVNLYKTFVKNFSGIAYRARASDWTPLFFHGAVEGITGYKDSEFCEGYLRWDQIIHEDDLPRLIAEYPPEVFDDPDFTAEREYRIIRKDGAVRTVLDLISSGSTPDDVEQYVDGTVLDITERKQVEDALQQAHEELEQRVVERTVTLRKLAVQLCHAEEAERKRIAHLLHDDLQQIIVGTRLMLSTLKKENVASRVRKHTLERAEDQLAQALHVMNSLAIDLYPPVLSTDGLCAAIPWLAGVMEERFGMSISVDVDKTAEPTTDSLRVFIFQTVRELLFNVVKHCDIKRAQVRLKQEHVGWILVEVKDSGAGFDAEQIDNNNRFGLFSIRERADYYGGQIKIQSAPGKGTRITLKLPCN